MSKLEDLKLIFLASTKEKSGLSPIAQFWEHAAEFWKTVPEECFEFFISKIISKKDPAFVSFIKIKHLIEDIETIVNVKNQQASNEVGMIMKNEKEKWDNPKDLLVSTLILKIRTKLYNKYSQGWQAFKYLDQDSDGSITFPEF